MTSDFVWFLVDFFFKMRARLNDLKIFDLSIRPLDCLKTRFVSSSRSARISNTKDGHGRIDGTSTSNKEKKHAS